MINTSSKASEKDRIIRYRAFRMVDRSVKKPSVQRDKINSKDLLQVVLTTKAVRWSFVRAIGFHPDPDEHFPPSF